jgi:hypothetical protein
MKLLAEGISKAERGLEAHKPKGLEDNEISYIFEKPREEALP